MSHDLVVRAQRGDHAAFEVLAAIAIDRLYALACLILRDADLAADATQEALFRAWRDLPALRDPDRWEAWLRRLLVHACMDEARSRRRFEARVRVIDTEPAGDDETRGMADRESVVSALHALPLEQRTVLAMRYYLDLTVPEMADALGLPVGTVKSRLHYATKALRASLDADGRLALAEATG